MSRVLVCADGYFRAISPFALEPYVEGFIDSLVKGGNDVFTYIESDFKSNPGLQRFLQKKTAFAQVKRFDPEIIFAFNNALDPSFLSHLDCPVYLISLLATDSGLPMNQGTEGKEYLTHIAIKKQEKYLKKQLKCNKGGF